MTIRRMVEGVDYERVGYELVDTDSPELDNLRAEWRQSLLRLDQRHAEPRPRFWRRRQVPEVVLAIPTARTRGLESVKLTDFSLKSYYFAIRADLPHAAGSQP